MCNVRTFGRKIQTPRTRLRSVDEHCVKALHVSNRSGVAFLTSKDFILTFLSLVCTSQGIIEIEVDEQSKDSRS